jgi:hypothetical protein
MRLSAPAHPPIAFAPRKVLEIIKCYLSCDGKPYHETSLPSTPGEDIISIAANWFNDQVNEKGPMNGGGYLGAGSFKTGYAVRICVVLSNSY